MVTNLSGEVSRWVPRVEPFNQINVSHHDIFVSSGPNRLVPPKKERLGANDDLMGSALLVLSGDDSLPLHESQGKCENHMVSCRCNDAHRLHFEFHCRRWSRPQRALGHGCRSHTSFSEAST